jgi:nucleoside-diphosphate-sugar epimerase
MSLSFLQLYPVAGDWQKTIKIVEKIDDELLECFMPIYNNFKPNSYVYAKALSEHVCESYKNQIPITIVRPSIVVGTELEPIAGWNDNFNGPGMSAYVVFGVESPPFCKSR